MDTISPRSLGLLAGQLPVVARNATATDAARMPPIKRIIRMAVRWRWVLLGGVAAGAVLGLGVSMMMTRLYASTSRLEISRETARVTKIEGVERETSIGDQEFYQTQYGLLQATALAERVARDLHLVDDPAFFRMFSRSDVFRDYGQPLNDPLKRAKRMEIAGQILLDHVGIAPVRGSSLVDITAMAPDPALSQRIAQAWSRDFIDTNLERRFEASDYARHFLEGRIEELRQRLEESERRAVAYAASQGIINLPAPGTRDENGNSSGGERSLLTDDIGTLNNALAVATAERIAAEARLAATSRPGSSEEALANQGIAQLREKRAEAAGEYAKLSSQFEPQYPQVKALADQVASLDRAIAEEGDRVHRVLVQNYQTALGRERALQARVDALKGEFVTLRGRSIQYNIYQRDVETNRELYNSLLQRYKEIGVAGGIENNNVAVINAAKLPDRPARPNLLVNLLLSILAGGVIGAGVAAALDQIDEGINDPSEVPEKLDMPLLGAAPRVQQGAPMEVLRNPRSALVEAYLAVQANLELSTARGTPRSFAVTSTRPREGKSTTALALAQSLARARRKVILIDADMRSPSVHSTFGATGEFGLSNLLSGAADEIDRAIHASGQEGLSIMPAGPQPPNAADLLTGPALRSLIERLEDRFDHVIIDCPPVLGLADAPLVTAAVERVVFVVEFRSIQAGTVRTALHRLMMAQANILGIVLTKFEAKRAVYGYGYEYGYGNDRAGEEARPRRAAIIRAIGGDNGQARAGEG